jgi:hypothetical protein
MNYAKPLIAAPLGYAVLDNSPGFMSNELDWYPKQHPSNPSHFCSAAWQNECDKQAKKEH